MAMAANEMSWAKLSF